MQNRADLVGGALVAPRRETSSQPTRSGSVGAKRDLVEPLPPESVAAVLFEMLEKNRNHGAPLEVGNGSCLPAYLKHPITFALVLV
jgi:hypothetical protein